jgi:glucose/arabinose dehydrogenase
MALRSAFAAGAALVLASSASADCSNQLKVDYPAPVAAEGWSYQLVAKEFNKPRGIAFDKDGSLLVVDSGNGLVHLTFNDEGDTCVSVDQRKTLLESEEVYILSYQ